LPKHIKDLESITVCPQLDPRKNPTSVLKFTVGTIRPTSTPPPYRKITAAAAPLLSLFPRLYLDPPKHVQNVVGST